MANKPGLVARMFGRTKNSVVTTLYTHALGQPLLVQPALGEALIGAYLDGAVDAPHTLVEGPGSDVPVAAAEPVQTIRVLNVSGALVNRPMPDICGPGPLSYEAIGKAFDAAMDDDTVKAVVLRLSSPGGMAAGCFDLTDRMHAQRGKKPVYAMVDDYAYSACYALAATADEIWLTRTAGVGSVGVVTFHYDQSGYNSKIGLKVTPIYAGDHKVDFNPHMPLSKEAFADAQAEVDRLRDLFVDSVAKYRGMEPDAVRATEAATYNGPAAVAAGMADKVGTMRDLLAHIENPSKPEAEAANDDAQEGQETQEGEGEQAQASTPAPDAAAFTLEVSVKDTAIGMKGALAEALAASDLAPDLVKALLSIDTSVPFDAEKRISHARTVADLCAAAGLREAAAGYVTRHVDVEQVRVELAAARADVGPEVVTTLPAGPAAQAPRTMSQDVYSRRREAAAGTGN